jgi:predicted AAA+ superfamily ATPase
MIKRQIESRLLSASKQYPVVTVTGPRQSGKTTLIRNAFPDYRYVSLEEPDRRREALEDPRGFLEHYSDNVIFDEAQRAPELFSYIQTLVDENNKSGRFILSGSQNFLLSRSISQSLAGRCAVLHLLPFSAGELKSDTSLCFNQLTNSNYTKQLLRRSPFPGSVFPMIRKGFYPRIHDKKLNPAEWLSNYFQTYLERDVRELLNVGDMETFGRFVRLCAGRNGQILNLTSLGNDCGVSYKTAQRWLSVLEAGFIIMLLRPYYRNFNKRLIKTPKLYFLDTGLLCWLLNIHDAEQLMMHSSRGAVFESFAISECRKYLFNTGTPGQMYFWRESNGIEIDLLIDSPDGIIPIEVKSAQTIAGDFFKNLNSWRKAAGLQEQTGALIYAGTEAYMHQNTLILPAGAL